MSKTTQTNEAVAKVVRQFLYGLISADEAIALLVARCGMTQGDAEEAIRGEPDHHDGCVCEACLAD